MNEHCRSQLGALRNPEHRKRKPLAGTLYRLGLVAVIAVCCCANGSPVAAQLTRAGSGTGHKRVYVPISELETILNRDRSGVLLSDAEFRQLIAAAKKNTPSFLKSPSGVIVRSTRYNLVFDRTRLAIQARVAFAQLRPGWCRVPLNGRGMSVESATLDGEPVRYLGRANDGQGELELVSNEPGEHTLLLELSVPVAMVGSDQVAAMGLIPSAVSSLRVQLPEKQYLVVDGLNVGRSADGAYEIPVGGRAEVRLRVTERKQDQAGDALVFAGSAIGLQVTPGEISWRAVTSLQVYGQAVDRLVFSVPNTLEIADVQSSGLESWELADSETDPERTTITLNYRQPFQNARRVTLTGVSATDADQEWQVPNLILNHVTAHTGRVVLRFPRGTRLVLNQLEGVRRSVDVEPGKRKQVSATQRMIFDVWQESFNLTFVTQMKQREVTASLSTIIDITQYGIDLETVVTLESRYAPLFQADLTIPAEWSMVAATVAGKPADWTRIPRQAGTRQIRLNLPRPLLPGQSLQIAIRAHRDLEDWPGTRASAEFELPEVRLLQSQVVDGTYLIKADDDFDVIPQDVRGLIPAYLNISGERAGFRYQDTRFTANLRVAHRPARISATTLVLSRLDPQVLRTHWESTIDIAGGGVESLAFTLPEALGDQLRLELPADPQQASSAPRILEQGGGEVVDGLRNWVIKFDRRAKGQITLVANVEQRRNDAEQLTIPILRVVDADRQSGYIAVEASAEQHLQITATDARNQTLADVDPADLPTMLPAAGYVPQERVVAAFRYVTPDVSVQLQEDRFPREPVPTAVADRLELTSALGQTGRFQHAARLEFRAVGVQGLLVELPAESTLWSTVIDGVPIEVRKRSEVSFLIPLPKSDDVAATRTLQVFYETQLDQRLDRFGTIQQQVPVLRIEAGADEPQALEVLDREWIVHYPQGTLLVSSSGRFQPVQDLDVASMFSGMEQFFQIGSPEHMLNNLWYVVICGGLLFLITLSFRRWGRLGCAAFTAVVALLLAVGLTTGITRLDPRSRFGGYDTADAPQASVGYSKVESAMEPMDEEMLEESAAMEAAAEGAADSRLSRATDSKQELAKDQPNMLPRKPTVIDSLGGQVDGSQLQQDVAETRTPEQAGEQVEQLGIGQAAGLDVQHNGRLSVRLELPELVDCRTMEFRYLGDGRSPGLHVEYANRNAARVCRLFVTLAIAFLGFWCQRNRAFRYKAIMASLGTTVPLALLTVTPGWLHVFLDGLFLGAICGTGLWGLRMIVDTLHRWLGPRSSARRMIVTGTLLWWLAGVGPSVTVLQATPQNAAPQSAARSPRPQSGPAQAASRAADAAARTSENTVIVPYEDGQDPLAAKRIYLPFDQYLELWLRAYPAKLRPMFRGRVNAAVYRAELRTADSAAARIHVTGRLVLHTFRAGQVAVELPLGRVALSAASLDGQPAPIRWATPSHTVPPLAETDETQQQTANPFIPQQQQAPQQRGPAAAQQQAQQQEVDSRPAVPLPVMSVLVSEPGAHVLDVEFDIPVKLTGPAGQFRLPLKPVPAGKLTFVLPGDDLLVRVNNATNTYRLRTVEDQDLVEVAVDAGGDLNLAWQPKQTRGPVDRIVHSASETALILDDAGTRIHTAFDFQVRQGTVAEITFSFPNRIRLQRISGPDVGGWQVEGAGPQRLLKVFLRRTVGDSTRIAIDLYQRDLVSSDGGTVPLPQFAPQGVARDTGVVGVFAEPQLEVRPGDSNGLRQIDADQFQPKLEITRPAGAPRLAYRYVARPVSLQLDVARVRAVTRVESEQAALVERRGIRLTSRFDFDLQGTPRSRVAVQLPDDYLPLSVDGNGLADWYVSDDDDGRQVLIAELVAPHVGKLEFVVQGSVVRDPEDEFVEVEVPYPLGVTAQNARLAIWVDPLYSSVIDEVEGWKSMNPSLLSADQRKLVARPAQFAFRSSELEVLPVALQLTRNVPRMTGDVVTVVNIYETSIEYSLNLKWRVQRSAADTFVFTTDSWLKDRVDVQCEGLRQVLQEETDDGRLRWTITLREPQRGEVFAMGTATLPPPSADNQALIQAPAVQLRHSQVDEDGRYAPLETQRQFVLLLNQSPYQMVPANTDAMAAVDPGALPIRLSKELLNAAAQIGQVRVQDEPPRWNVRALQKTVSAPASVNLADLITVIAEDGGWRTVARYNTKNRTRQFLPVVLPPQARLLSVFVKQAPARPVTTEIKVQGKQQTVYLVALPKTSAADLPFDIQLVIAGTLSSDIYQEKPQLIGQEIPVPAPRILTLAEHREFGIPVIRTRWNVYVPKSWEARAADDRNKNNLTQQSKTEAEALDQLAILNAANELFSVLRDKQSSKLKYRAWYNVNQLENSIQSSPGYGQQESLERGGEQGRVSSEVAREREKLRRNLDEFRNRIQIDEANQRAVLDQRGAEMLDSLGEESRDIERQNRAIFSDNTFRSNQQGQQKLAEFNFGVRQQDTGQQAAADEKKQTKDTSGLASKIGVKGRQRNFDRSLSQLSKQNMAYEDRRSGKPDQAKTPSSGKQPASKVAGGVSIPPATPRPTQQFNQPAVGTITTRTADPFGDTGGFGRGGMGGGLGRLGSNAAGPTTQAAVAAANEAGGSLPLWTVAGGLSLEVDIPKDGQQLTFTKVSGDPQLTLKVWPRSVVETGFGMIWTVVWLAVGCTCALALSRSGLAGLLRHSPKVMLTLGLVLFFVLPVPVHWSGFALFLLGGLLLAIQYRRSPLPA